MWNNQEMKGIYGFEITMNDFIHMKVHKTQWHIVHLHLAH